MPFRVIALRQTVSLANMNNCVKFHKIRLNSKNVMAKVKVFHNYNNDYTAHAIDDNRVMTILRLILFEKKAELKMHGKICLVVLQYALMVNNLRM